MNMTFDDYWVAEMKAAGATNYKRDSVFYALSKRAWDAAQKYEREACAVTAESLELTGREWVRDSLWANIKRDTAAAIRAR